MKDSLRFDAAEDTADAAFDEITDTLSEADGLVEDGSLSESGMNGTGDCAAEEVAVDSCVLTGEETEEIATLGVLFGAKDEKDDMTSVGDKGTSKEADAL